MVFFPIRWHVKTVNISILCGYLLTKFIRRNLASPAHKCRSVFPKLSTKISVQTGVRSCLVKWRNCINVTGKFICSGSDGSLKSCPPSISQRNQSSHSWFLLVNELAFGIPSVDIPKMLNSFLGEVYTLISIYVKVEISQLNYEETVTFYKPYWVKRINGMCLPNKIKHTS